MTRLHTIWEGDCVESMRTWVLDESVQTCVTSPPYFGLRDYGVAGQIGLEPTPDAYVAELVTVFREVKRVLRDDGTLWLNLGDSYAGGGTIGRNDTNPADLARRAQHYGTGTGAGSAVGSHGIRPSVGKPKDLLGIPWRVAFALQADGWYLRQDIIWHKPNPMPESVRDRCTKAHEYIFLLSKRERYYYDCDAIKEPCVNTAKQQQAKRNKVPHKGQSDPGGRRETTGGFTKTKIYEKRTRRSVWTVSTKPYRGAHFATFPPDLIEPCILAGSKPGDLVLDPFGGAGTTALVATKHGRRSVLCELNPEYVKLAETRLADAR